MTSSEGSGNARLCIPIAARSAMPVPLRTYITFRYSRGMNETSKPASPLFLNNTLVTERSMGSGGRAKQLFDWNFIFSLQPHAGAGISN